MVKKVLICSGKGGVGKTTISSRVAEELSKNCKVGLVDCDIDGPDVNVFLHINQEVGIGEKIKPIVRNNLEVISLGFMINKNDFIMWPSEKRAMAVQQLIQAVDWSNNLEYMVMDSPPGTSDEVEYIAGYFKPEIVLIVSTPEPMSISDVTRTIGMLNNFKSNIKGIIINNINTNIKCPSCGAIVKPVDIPDEISNVKVIANVDYSAIPEETDVSKIVSMIQEL